MPSQGWPKQWWMGLVGLWLMSILAQSKTFIFLFIPQCQFLYVLFSIFVYVQFVNFVNFFKLISFEIDLISKDFFLDFSDSDSDLSDFFMQVLI